MTRAEFLRRLPPARDIPAAAIPPVRYRDAAGGPLDPLDELAVQALFDQRWQALGGQVHRVTHAGVAAAVAAIVAGRTGVLVSESELLEGVTGELHWPKCGLADAAAAQIAVVPAVAALAATGSVVLDSRVSHGRSAALLAPEAVFVLRKSTVVAHLGDLLRRTAEHWPGGLPSQLVVVSGPSRSADIEHTLTRGVHGPGEVHAVIAG